MWLMSEGLEVSFAFRLFGGVQASIGFVGNYRVPQSSLVDLSEGMMSFLPTRGVEKKLVEFLVLVSRWGFRTTT